MTQRNLTADVLEAREDEARRIARQLHDEAGQITTSLHLALDEIARELPPSGRARVGRARALLEELEGRLRDLSHELRPTLLDDLGLLPALEYLAASFAARTGIDALVVGSARGRLDPAVETALYRVVQEALCNVARHARARHVSVRIDDARGTLRCAVRDDGVGFEAGASCSEGWGLGLRAAQERIAALGGRIEVRSPPGRGAELAVALPLRRNP